MTIHLADVARLHNYVWQGSVRNTQYGHCRRGDLTEKRWYDGNEWQSVVRCQTCNTSWDSRTFRQEKTK